jgi:hypothetical protein
MRKTIVGIVCLAAAASQLQDRRAGSVKFGGCRQGLTGAPTPHRHRAREHLGS